MISISISVGEALDRLSILIIKERKITDPKKLAHIKAELKVLKESLKDFEHPVFLQKLIAINETMWECNDTRKQKIKNQEFDEEYLKLTCIESNVNDERFLLKAEIDEYFGSEVREQKSYYWLT